MSNSRVNAIYLPKELQKVFFSYGCERASFLSAKEDFFLGSGRLTVEDFTDWNLFKVERSFLNARTQSFPAEVLRHISYNSTRNELLKDDVQQHLQYLSPENSGSIEITGVYETH